MLWYESDPEPNEYSLARSRMRLNSLYLSMWICCQCLTLDAESPAEFSIRREQQFEFAVKPSMRWLGEVAEISFETTAFCDVAIAIENAEGRIVRHLAYGVLGANAPSPFLSGSKKQKLTWDGKDDQGNYLEDRDSYTLRVSLGLKPQFEKSLYWHPKKRTSSLPSIPYAAPEGVFVYYPGPIGHQRLYSHDGDYQRTVYPFPANKVKDVKGLHWHNYPQDNIASPIKPTFLQNTLLFCGTNAFRLKTYKPDLSSYESVVAAGGNEHYGMYGHGAAGMAVRNGRIALSHMYLNRMGTDGSSGGMNLYGPPVHYPIQLGTMHEFTGGTYQVGPRSVAISPDGKTVYLAHFHWRFAWQQNGLHCVTKMSMDTDEPPQLFAGSSKQDGSGSENGQFRYATSVDVDETGRVYVSDYMNDRIQVFDPDGVHLRNIPVSRPAQVSIHRKTGEIWVFSWLVGNNQMVLVELEHQKKQKQFSVPPTVTRFASFDNPAVVKSYKLPLGPHTGYARSNYGMMDAGLDIRVALNSYSPTPELWVVPDIKRSWTKLPVEFEKTSIQILEEKNDEWVIKRDFGVEAAAALKRITPATYFRQRIYANPITGKLYVAESDSAAVGKSNQELVEMTGEIRLLEIPFSAEDMCFGPDGLAYIRTQREVSRFDPKDWREIPWDYGEERPKVGFGWSAGTKYAKAISTLVLPANSNWHHGGIGISPNGHLTVGCLYTDKIQFRNPYGSIMRSTFEEADLKYEPALYPGRTFSKKGTIIHVWDAHGQLIHEDAVPGLGDCYGVEIDRDDNIYVMSAATRIFVGKRYMNDLTGTLMKFKPGKGKIVSASSDVTPVPLTEETRPNRSPEMTGAIQGTSWAEGVEWMYGGVGYGGKNRGVGCACWNARFVLDYFRRSYAPEMDRYKIAVLDANGNVVTRIGQYGNADSSGPDSLVPLEGDGVGLFHAPYLATQTDKRLFIADPGNSRIVSVKLGYHVEEKVMLKNAARQ